MKTTIESLKEATLSRIESINIGGRMFPAGGIINVTKFGEITVSFIPVISGRHRIAVSRVSYKINGNVISESELSKLLNA